MWPDEPKDYKTPLGLKIALSAFVIVGSCLMAMLLTIMFSGI